MTDQEQGTFQTSNREVQTCIPSAIEMSVREVDWKRIHRKVKSIPKRSSIYQIISSVSWGVSGSALLSLIPLYQAITDAEAWVKPTFWVIGLSAALIGFISRKYEKERDAFISVTSAEVMKDMQEIYNTFFPDKKIEDE